MQLNSHQLDILTEVVNIGVGKSAGILNKILQKRVLLSIPSLQLLTDEELANNYGEHSRNRYSSVSMPFKGELQGISELIFPTHSVQRVIDLVINESAVSENLDLLRSSTLSEIGNIILNSLIGTLANLLKTRLHYSVPVYNEGTQSDLLDQYVATNTVIVLAHTNFRIKDIDIVGKFLLYLEFCSFQKLVEHIEKYRTQYS